MKAQRTAIGIALLLGSFIFFLGSNYESGCEPRSYLGRALTIHPEVGLTLNLVMDPTTKEDTLLPAVSIETSDPAHDLRILTLEKADFKIIALRSEDTHWHILLADDERVRIIFKGTSHPKTWRVEAREAELFIWTEKEGPQEAELRLPQSFGGQVNLSNEYGDFTIESLAQASRVNIVNFRGQTVVHAGPSEQLDIKASYGDTQVAPASTSSQLILNFESITGDLSLNLCSPIKRFSADTVTGDLDLFIPDAQAWSYKIAGLGIRIKGMPSGEPDSFLMGSTRGAWGAHPQSQLSFDTLSGTLAVHTKKP